MALVCDMKSEDKPSNDDLEDGEIEDDDEDLPIAPVTGPQKEISDGNATSAATTSSTSTTPQTTPQKPQLQVPDDIKFTLPALGAEKYDKAGRHDRRKHDEKKKHLTEAEKSVMHLHKLERMEREKRDKYKRDNNTDIIDDFASNIEKAIASVLKKDKSQGEHDPEEKRGKKRKKNRKRPGKKLKLESPKSDDFDETEMLNMRGGSPELKLFKDSRLSSPKSEEYDESYDSEYSSECSGERKRDFRKGGRQRARDRRERKHRGRSRDKKDENATLRDGNICIYNIQGKCGKADDCPYNHDVTLPMKLELCKFYLMGCCAKGVKCLYMHSEFPCKFYHTGIQCFAGDDCKFAHGKPLSEPLRQILFKHIETAPKEILGEFPRLSREGAQTRIMQAQKSLEAKYGMEKKEGVDKNNIPSLFDINIPVPPELIQGENVAEKKDKPEKPTRNRPSRWQDPDPEAEQTKLAAITMGFLQTDQDMRISSNGDIDMRTLPPPPLAGMQTNQPQPQRPDFTSRKDVDIRHQHQQLDHLPAPKEPDSSATATKDIDSRGDMFLNKDLDIRHYSASLSNETEDDNNADELALQIVVDEECDQQHPPQKPDEQLHHEDEAQLKDTDIRGSVDFSNLPKTQRDLFLRIQAQQKENTLDKQEQDYSDNDDNNVDWYSDDEDDLKLTIKVDEDKEQREQEKAAEAIKPQEIVERLGDLSKLDISAEVTKLLSSISGQSKEAARNAPSDPRISRRLSAEKKPEKISIYEQGFSNMDVDLRDLDKDTDLRSNLNDMDLRGGMSMRSDVDLRQLNLPFKAIQNYTPASEIDASINSHPPISWKVYTVDVPKPDYTGLKLNAQDPQVNGDPRLRKIFRLSVEEKDSPASPKQSPKASYGLSSSASSTRVDPRRRKLESDVKPDTNSMTYAQQLTMLQSSPFYQSLTSNQKVMLNQELAQRTDHSGTNDPLLASMLANLGLIQNANLTPSSNANALSIFSNLNNLSPIGNLLNPSLLTNQASLLAQNANMLGPNPNMMNQNPNMLGPNQQGSNTGNILQPSMMNNQLGSNMAPMMGQGVGQPGLLGAAPGIPNMNAFEINFDPRNGGLLGNAPPFTNFDGNNSNFNNYNEDFYEGGGGGGGGNNRGDNNRGFRDNRSNRRGGRSFNNRNNGNNRNFRNRRNRGHTPP